MMKRMPRILAVSALLLTVGLSGCGKKADWGAPGGKPGVGDPGGAIPVQTATVRQETITQTVAVTGNLVALDDVQLSAKAAGRVTGVFAHTGQAVTAGQLLVQQDTTDLDANVRQAEANVLSAQAKVSQAMSNLQIQQTSAEQDVQNAQSKLDAARQNYQKVKNGVRPQELLQSQNSVLSAKASRDNAQTILKRNKALFAEGAIAQADVDQAQTNYDVAAAQYKNTLAALGLAKEGSRKEDIASALQQVKQAETAYATAVANRRQVPVRRDDILAAQAAVAQAKATLAYNQQQVANAFIRSPISGIVASRTTEPGQIATPGTILMRIVDVKSTYYQPVVSETDLARISIGTPVTVKVDAGAGHVYEGHVTTIYPSASTTDREFSVRVAITNKDGFLRPGMFARGEIVVRVAKDVPVVPATALVPDSINQGYVPNGASDAEIGNAVQTVPQHVVVVGADDKASLRSVRVGIATMEKAQIESGLQPGERIVVVGQRNLRNGDKLAVQPAVQAAADETHRAAM